MHPNRTLTGLERSSIFSDGLPVHFCVLSLCLHPSPTTERKKNDAPLSRWAKLCAVNQFTRRCTQSFLLPTSERLSFFNCKPLLFANLCVAEQRKTVCLNDVDEQIKFADATATCVWSVQPLVTWSGASQTISMLDLRFSRRSLWRMSSSGI
jgi:hypothetical protein